MEEYVMLLFHQNVPQGVVGLLPLGKAVCVGGRKRLFLRYSALKPGYPKARWEPRARKPKAHTPRLGSAL